MFPLASKYGTTLRWSWLCLPLLVSACDCGGGTSAPCTTNSDCTSGLRCVDGVCHPGVDGGSEAGLPDGGRDGAVDAEAGPPPGPPCDAAGRCEGDARCMAGRCVPWGPGESDPSCRRPRRPGAVIPSLQCAFEQAPEDDPRPTAVRLLHTPLVADLGIGVSPDAPSRPSIVYVADFGYREGAPRGCEGRGLLRILDGASCRQQAVFDALEFNSPVTPALGDLDGDGLPEIVAAVTEGGLAALDVSPDGRIDVLWRTRRPDGSLDLHGSDACQWGAVTLFDVDDDGRPEVFFEGVFWGADGVRRGSLPGWVRLPTGTPVTLGDYDMDGKVEAVSGNATWEYDPSSGSFSVESGFSTSVPPGHVAVADFGDFSAAGGVPGQPEVVSVSSGTVSLRTLSGGLVGSVGTATSGYGGPPTVADFDGDGARDIGVAFGGSYEVYRVTDSGLARIWSQPSQDLSSSRTGSSVFDFNGDGRAEVVYGDECFVRVYDGQSGEVLFSQARFSSTWTEYPIVADVDSDGSAEIVMGASGPCNPDYCPELDPLFTGLHCEENSDCLSGRCEGGLCRCADDTECPRTYGCAPPVSDTGANVCRAFHRDCRAGVRVYRDARDGWAASRRIWNQHAYHVTNVEEDGTVPRTSTVPAHWADPDINSFRKNVQGELGEEAGADLTVRSVQAGCLGSDRTEMSAELCNRGAVFLDVGLQVVFDLVSDDGTRDRLCDLRTEEPVPPGACTIVSCEAPVPAQGTFEAIADEEDVVAECDEANNSARSQATCLE